MPKSPDEWWCLQLDRGVGRLRDALVGVGVGDDTLTIVTSDNGPWYEGATGGLRGRKACVLIEFCTSFALLLC